MKMDHLLNSSTKKFLEKKQQEITRQDEKKIRLYNNENPLGSPTLKWYNRFLSNTDNAYLIAEIGKIKNVPPEKIFLSMGYFSLFDLLVRTICEPATDQVLLCTPAPGALISICTFNNINYHEVPLAENRQLDLLHFEHAVQDKTKLIWIASPNYVTGNNMILDDLETILNNFSGQLVLDESFINFSRHHSLISLLHDYPNLLIVQNFHYAWGLAGLEVEMAFASEEIIYLLHTLPVSRPINAPVTQILLEAFSKLDQVNTTIREIVTQRKSLAEQLKQYPFIETIFPSDANFLLIQCRNTKALYLFLEENDIAVQPFWEDKFFNQCLRISIGSTEENRKLLHALAAWKEKENKASAT